MAVSNKSKQNLAHPNIKIPPPLLALIHVALAFVLTWLLPLPFVVSPTIQVVGFVLATLGFLLGIGALIAFRRARSTRKTHDSASQLVTFGIYRFTRNPVYLGFLFMLMGITLNSGSYWGVLLAPVLVVLFNQLVIGPEEEYLAYRFGEPFSNYKARVRRWI